MSPPGELESQRIASMKRLLVNADDFGLCQGVTDGIIQAHRQGIVTSTSIMAGGGDFNHAVQQAGECPGLGVGVHLTLVEEQPVCAASQIPSLVQGDGRLPRNYAALLSGVALGRIPLREVEAELRAQVEKCLRAGLSPTHLDSHQHVHALPSILHIVLKIARDYGIPGIRMPRDARGRASGASNNGSLAKSLLCLLARYDARAFPMGPFSICDRAAGIFDSGNLSEDRLLKLLHRLMDGDTELVCHPGREGGSTMARYAHWDYHWQTELAALTCVPVRETIKKLGIALIGYRDLTPKAPV